MTVFYNSRTSSTGLVTEYCFVNVFHVLEALISLFENTEFEKCKNIRRKSLGWLRYAIGSCSRSPSFQDEKRFGLQPLFFRIKDNHIFHLFLLDSQ